MLLFLSSFYKVKIYEISFGIQESNTGIPFTNVLMLIAKKYVCKTFRHALFTIIFSVIISYFSL